MTTDDLHAVSDVVDAARSGDRAAHEFLFRLIVAAMEADAFTQLPPPVRGYAITLMLRVA